MRRSWLRFDPVTLLATLLVGVIPSVLLISVSLLYLTGVSINLTEQVKEPHRERARSCCRALDDAFQRWEADLTRAVQQSFVGRPTPESGSAVAETAVFADWELVSVVQVQLPRPERHLNPTTISEQDRAEALVLALSHSSERHQSEGLEALSSLPLALEDPMGFPYAIEARMHSQAPMSPVQQRDFLLNAAVLEPASVSAVIAAHGAGFRVPGVPLPLQVWSGSALPVTESTVTTPGRIRSHNGSDVLSVPTTLPGGAVVTCEAPVAPLLRVLLARVEAEVALPDGVYLELVTDADPTPPSSVPAEGREWERWPLSAPFHRTWQVSTGTTVHSALDPLSSLNRLQDIHLLWGGLAVLAVGVLFSLCLAAVVSRRVQQSQERDNFLRLVSHELRTPIASVKMLAETLTLGRVRNPEEQQQFLHQMETEIDRLADLVERVLEYGRAGQGKTASREVVTDPGELVEDVVEQFREQLPTEAPLTVQTAQHFHPVVLDQEAVRGVVMNLLTNAQKYSPEGAPIEVTVGEESRQLYIRVRDHGAGMRRRELKQIFRPFSRGDHNSRIPGFGLGLAYCKQVAAAHRGQIKVWSRVGTGSAFTLEIPLSLGKTTEQVDGEESAGS